MRVIDGTLGIDDLDGAVRKRLLFTLPSGDGPQAAFMEQLWAWWYDQVVEMLQKRRTSVSVGAVHRRVEQIRDDYAADRLPTLVERSDWQAVQRQGVDYSERHFVHQLRWVNVGRPELEKAVMDYYRAYNQAVAWAGLDELDRYQADLVDEWERLFARMVRRLPADASEQDGRTREKSCCGRCWTASRSGSGTSTTRSSFIAASTTAWRTRPVWDGILSSCSGSKR